MRLIIALLSLLLGVSVCLNIYYYFLIKPLPSSIEAPTPVRHNPAVEHAATQNNKQPTWYLDAHHAFENQRFEQAVSLINLINRENPNKIALLDTWYEQAGKWLASENYATFIAFEQSFLKFDPNNIQVLLLSAQKELRLNSINAGIGAYYDLLDLPMTNADKNLIQNQLHQIITQHIQTLKQAQAWQVLQTLSETLLNFEPDNVSYILTLAESYAQQQDAALTEFAIGLLPYSALSDPRVSQIRELLRTNTPSSQLDESSDGEADLSTVSTVELTRTGEHYIVNTLFNERYHIELLIDTGASTTTLSSRVFERYFNNHNTRYLGQYTLNTANGLTQAPVYQVKNVSLGDYVLDNVAVVVLPLAYMRDADGLLGMNVLSAFDFRIDQSRAQLLLSPRDKN